MTRAMAIAAVLLGILQVPLGLSAGTSWLIPGAHLLLCLLATPLAIGAGWRGQPAVAASWAAWVVVATGGGMLAVHIASWTEGGWSWMLPYVSTLAWAWVPVAAGGIAARMASMRRWRLARAAVRARHRQHAAQQAVDAVAALSREAATSEEGDLA